MEVSLRSATNIILNDPKYKMYIWITIPLVLMQFLIFKYFYPFAGFINGDSYVYLETAYHNFSINTYPIGYSKFLRLFSVFSKSDTLLVSFQYALLQGSSLYFFLTILHFYSPQRGIRIVLFIFLLLNPVSLYLANYVSSDSFFLGLSLIWFTQLIWICHTPTNKLIFVNAIVLFILFTVRYNALYYPIIQGISLLLVRQKIWIKSAGMALSLVLIGSFIQFTSSKYEKLTGVYQFTPFTGWQMANNAMYAYRYVDSAHVKQVPKRFQKIDKMVRTYFDTTRDVKKNPQEMLMASTVYMWAPNSPLSIYMNDQSKGDTSATDLKKWARTAPLMKEYGSFLMQQYPRQFITYYLIPNALKYYAPPVEFLESYSTGVDSVSQIAEVWFDYPSNKIKTRFKDFKVNTLKFFPVLTGTMNVVLLFSIISFFLLRGDKEFPSLKLGVILVTALWAINFGFSVFASPIALRFQLFPIIVSTSFTFLLIDFLIRKASEKEPDTVSAQTVPINEAAMEEQN